MKLLRLDQPTTTDASSPPQRRTFCRVRSTRHCFHPMLMSEHQTQRTADPAELRKCCQGTVLSIEKTRETLRLSRDGKEFWMEVWAEFTSRYRLTVVEKSPVAQDIPANADVLSNDTEEGRAKTRRVELARQEKMHPTPGDSVSRRLAGNIGNC
jgi:hypothetical protein